ncbi:unnamed protein product [Effrenium voratum]|nr:unnamed protein product [Effrenium voratum]
MAVKVAEPVSLPTKAMEEIAERERIRTDYEMLDSLDPEYLLPELVALGLHEPLEISSWKGGSWQSDAGSLSSTTVDEDSDDDAGMMESPSWSAEAAGSTAMKFCSGCRECDESSMEEVLCDPTPSPERLPKRQRRE